MILIGSGTKLTYADLLHESSTPTSNIQNLLPSMKLIDPYDNQQLPLPQICK